MIRRQLISVFLLCLLPSLIVAVAPLPQACPAGYTPQTKQTPTGYECSCEAAAQCPDAASRRFAVNVHGEVVCSKSSSAQCDAPTWVAAAHSSTTEISCKSEQTCTTSGTPTPAGPGAANAELVPLEGIRCLCHDKKACPAGSEPVYNEKTDTLSCSSSAAAICPKTPSEFEPTVEFVAENSAKCIFSMPCVPALTCSKVRSPDVFRELFGRASESSSAAKYILSNTDYDAYKATMEHIASICSGKIFNANGDIDVPLGSEGSCCTARKPPEELPPRKCDSIDKAIVESECNDEYGVDERHQHLWSYIPGGTAEPSIAEGCCEKNVNTALDSPCAPVYTNPDLEGNEPFFKTSANVLYGIRHTLQSIPNEDEHFYKEHCMMGCAAMFLKLAQCMQQRRDFEKMYAATDKQYYKRTNDWEKATGCSKDFLKTALLPSAVAMKDAFGEPLSVPMYVFSKENEVDGVHKGLAICDAMFPSRMTNNVRTFQNAEEVLTLFDTQLQDEKFEIAMNDLALTNRKLTHFADAPMSVDCRAQCRSKVQSFRTGAGDMKSCYDYCNVLFAKKKF